MATNATINKYLNGYPNLLGNKKQVVLIMNGPDDYLAGGVNINSVAHVKNVHYINCSAAGDGLDFLLVFPVFDPDKPQSLADVKLVFIDPSTGLEAIDTADLSTFLFRMEVVGTN